MARRHPFPLLVESLDDRCTPALIGAPDPAFGTNGLFSLNLGGSAGKFSAVVVQPDGRTVTAGTNGNDFILARFLENGSLDTSFGASGFANIDFGGNDVANALLLDSTGRFVAVGRTSMGAGGGDFAAARLTPDGKLDTSFGTNGRTTVDIGGQADSANSATFDSSNRIVMAGSSGSAFGIARLDASGKLDTTFGTNGTKTVSFNATDDARAVFVIPSTQKIIVAGSTTRTGQNDGIDRDFVAVRLEANGQSIDTDFGTQIITVGSTKFSALVINFGGNDALFGGVADPNGRYILVGTANQENFAAARIDMNGNLDKTFNTTGKTTVDFGGADIARSVYVQPNNRIVIAGSSTSTNGQSNLATTRLLTEGTADTSFNATGRSVVPITASGGTFGTAMSVNGDVVLAGTNGNSALIGQLNGTVGVPSLLLTGGSPDGAVRQYIVQDGNYVAAPAFAPFPGIASATRVAVGDLNGDGIPERIAVTGPGTPTLLVVYDGKTGTLLATQAVFEESFTGGLFVAAGDINRDGFADVAVSPDQGGGPRVRVYDGAALAQNVAVFLADFLAIEDPNFRGGARPAIGDVNNDGYADLVVSAGFTGGPRIAVWNGKTLAAGSAPGRLVSDFFAFEPTLRDGAFVAMGDINGDGFSDFVFGGGPNGGPRVRIISGGGLLSAPAFQTLDQIPQAQLANFFAGDPNTRGGIRLTVKDVDGDNLADLVTGSGDRLPSQALLFLGKNLLGTPNSPPPDQTLDPFGGTLANGVFVG